VEVERFAPPDGTSQASPGGEDDCFVLFFAGDMFTPFPNSIQRLSLAPDSGAVV